MRLGKLDNDQLERLILQKFKKTRPESFAVPEVGMDCAMLDLDGDLAVLSCDPITSAKLTHLGSLTVHVSCNDAAAAGADPVGLLITLLAPPTATAKEIGTIADDIAKAAAAANVDILGGHTEVTDSVTRYVTNATVIARMPKEACLVGMREGDDVVITKWAGLEGSTIIAADYADRLEGLNPSIVANALRFDKYLSVVLDGKIAARGDATAMHDITEGGVYGACWEMSYISGCGMTIDPDKIPLRPETIAICKHLSLDPFRLISSGSMLIACKDGKKLCRELQMHGVPATIIGQACGTHVKTVDGQIIPPPGADELYRLS